ncbi:pectate lyase [Hymenobacter sp. BT770]|uniref:pectate lyase family protein n=1 Tax=Hymenobacter sp. BT770 TaxID=2886942 RepID=UPI001D11BDA7|nr:pectate lyase [Hymenobacter sp. BT770]MCC3154366.1 pectate lyase [Hymenobacter sp. BT770]MDO3415687.1 pectate lyase [Hymenobacter sp. BT770]
MRAILPRLSFHHRSLRIIWVLGLSLLLAPARGWAQGLVAFPGAEGAGRFTTGGRGSAAVPTTVFEVTSLNDDGKAGSLRYALSQPAAARTVVFRVSGTIHLGSPLEIKKANTTIAGQTAPGDGICLADYPVMVRANNVIVRFMRFRMGDKNQNQGFVDGAGGDDAFGGQRNNHLIVDHCSMSWSTDEVLSVYEGDSTTLQWNLIAEPLNYSYHYEKGDKDFERHGFGGIWGGQHSSFHHNLFAHCKNRTPRFNGSRYTHPAGFENCDFSNNVIYNWGENNVYAGEGGNYNVVNNYYKPGPNTDPKVRAQVLNPYKIDKETGRLPYGKFYLTGNYVAGAPAITAHNWRGVVMNGGTAADTAQSKVDQPFVLGPLALQTAPAAYEAVLLGAGAIRPRRDTLDQRIVREVRAGTGTIIDVQGHYPHGTPYSVSQRAWPVLKSTPAPADADHDGMPDAWEKAHGLNPASPADRALRAPNGYTNLESYLNSLVPSAAAGAPVPAVPKRSK